MINMNYAGYMVWLHNVGGLNARHQLQEQSMGELPLRTIILGGDHDWSLSSLAFLSFVPLVCWCDTDEMVHVRTLFNSDFCVRRPELLLYPVG